MTSADAPSAPAPLRIALYHDLPSGGAKRTLMEAARRLSSRHHVDVFTLSCADHHFADLRPWVARYDVAPFSPLPLLRSPFGRVNQLMRRADLARLDRVAARVARRIDDGGYDVALVHPCRYEQAPSVLRHLRSTPSVYYCHEPLRLVYEPMPARPYDEHSSGRRRLLNAIDPFPAVYRRALRATDRRNTRGAGTVLVNSRFTAEAVARVYGIASTVSYHGVDTDHFRPTGEPRQQFVLSVGSLTPLKGFDFLIDALATLPPSARPPLVVASNFQNPLEREFLRVRAARARVDLTLHANVCESDLVRFYNQARAVLYAPVREPFGLVPLEAMACGTPVVAVADGGIPETVIDGRTGVLASRDPAGFGAAVARMLTDHTAAGRVGHQGREHVLQHWTWDRAITDLEGVLVAVVNRRRRRTIASVFAQRLAGVAWPRA